jgi:hypothetical protein
MPLSDRLKQITPTQLPRKTPVWKGPEEDGITFSLLSRFLVCRERFRLLVVEGLTPAEGWNHRIGYGNFWHVCEEALARGDHWAGPLLDHAKKEARRYPTQQEQVDHWYQVCLAQFPHYVEYWSRHPDVKERTPLLQEQVFAVPYRLPSGRTVRLRGKWDSVDLVGKSKPAVYLQENKTKGDIRDAQLRRQLTRDLQTMLYLVALSEKPSCDLPRTGHYRHSDGKEYPIAGVRYNVIRRPLSGGKGNIRQHQRGESRSEYYARLGELIQNAVGPEWDCAPDEHYFFKRWTVTVPAADVQRFRRETLDPILEHLCRWWDYVSEADGLDLFGPHRNADAGGIHWVYPFGVWNPLDQGGSSDLDSYLESGSEVGLTRTTELFPELMP